MSVHQTKDGRWFSTYYDGPKKKFEYFGRGDLAKRKAEIRDAEIKQNKGKLRIDGGLTIAEICQQYHCEHPVKESTLKSDFYRLSKIILPALGEIQAEALTTQDLNKYVAKRLEEGRSRRTVGREISLIKAAFNWAAAQDPPLILRNPLAKFTLAKSRESDIPPPVTEEELRALLEHAPAHLIRAMLIQWYGGMRPGGEVSRILWSDVNFSGREIRVVSASKGGPVLRYVPIHDNLLPVLKEWKKEDEKKLSARNERRNENTNIQSVPVVHYRFKKAQSLKRAWAETKKAAGVTRRLRLYDFRHAWYTNILKAGADLKTASIIGGHSRADTPLRFYQHVVKSQHREVIDKVPVVELATNQLLIVKNEKKNN